MGREAVIEMYLRKQVQAAGGKCYKWVSPGRRGVPDRICIFPGGRVLFVELKAPGEHERPDQLAFQATLRRLGCTVFSTISTREQVDEIIKGVK